MSITRQHQSTRNFGYSLGLTDGMLAYYDAIGPREGDVTLAFALAGDPQQAQVLEIGCGTGRDAVAIARRASHYIGLEESQPLLDLASKRVPKGSFIMADALNFDFQPASYDIVFAFASLRFLQKDDMAATLRTIHGALTIGGICYLSLNYGERYQETIRRDQFGTRRIMLYNPELIQRLAGGGYKKVHETTDTIAGDQWFEIALQRIV